MAGGVILIVLCSFTFRSYPIRRVQHWNHGASVLRITATSVSWDYNNRIDKYDVLLGGTKDSEWSCYLFGGRSAGGYHMLWIRGLGYGGWNTQPQTGFIGFYGYAKYTKLAYAAAFLPVTSILFACVRRRIRKRKGRCLSCGYDMTGNQSGNCPEYGVSRQAPTSKQ